MKQMQFDINEECKRNFGGELLVGKRKSARPISTNKAMHIVLRSDKARKELSFVNHRRYVEKTIAQVCAKLGVRLYAFAVNFDHLHLVAKFSTRLQYKQWIRELSSAIVKLLINRTGIKLSKFFSLRPFSTIISWGRQFRCVLDYQIKNQLELFGIYRPKRPRQENRTAKNLRKRLTLQT